MKRPRQFDTESGELTCDINITPASREHSTRFNPFGHPAPVITKGKEKGQNSKKERD